MYNTLAYSISGNGRKKLDVAAEKGGSTEPHPSPLAYGPALSNSVDSSHVDACALPGGTHIILLMYMEPLTFTVFARGKSAA